MRWLDRCKIHSRVERSAFLNKIEIHNWSDRLLFMDVTNYVTTFPPFPYVSITSRRLHIFNPKIYNCLIYSPVIKLRAIPTHSCLFWRQLLISVTSEENRSPRIPRSLKKYKIHKYLKKWSFTDGRNFDAFAFANQQPAGKYTFVNPSRPHSW